MSVSREGNIFDQINMWVQRADQMTAMVGQFQNEIGFQRSSSRPGVSSHVLQILPTIVWVKHSVMCDGVPIPLGRMQTPRKLFRVFLRRPFAAFTREELVERIYGRYAPKLRTDRLNQAMNKNLIKLISRTRLIAETALNTGPVKWIEWFPHDPETNLWSFYRLTSTYLLDMQIRLDLGASYDHDTHNGPRF